ncbi:hypothetical protein C8F01DRAFT_25482 [Mycena amicta]|nr:hypothetical protein C8F01DRAFT_25482 [Mycena amicta]
MHMSPPSEGLSPLPSPSVSSTSGCAPSFVPSDTYPYALSRFPTAADHESSRSSWSSDSDSDCGGGDWNSDSELLEDWWDDWPADFDGTGLFQRLLEVENSTGEVPSLPLFRFDVRDVLDEVEAFVGNSVVDIPRVGRGANYFGMHLVLKNEQNILARIARLDVNWLNYEDAGRLDDLVNQQIVDVEFEAAVYRLLAQHCEVLAANLLFCRAPQYRRSSGREPSMPPQDVQGRALFVFEKTEGLNNVWPSAQSQKLLLLEHCARIRSALFSLILPRDFVCTWITRRPPCTSANFLGNVHIAPTRAFALAFLTAKLDEVIASEDNAGFGWFRDPNSEHTVVGPRALHAKGLLRKLIPLVLPFDDGELGLYRFVLEHGDFGIHNMSIIDRGTTEVESIAVTSLYDWESGHILPALLSNPQLAVYVDLQLDSDGKPAISRTWEGITEQERREQVQYSEHYYRALDKQQSRYLPILKAGQDARHIWSALISWAGSAEDPELYFGQLGDWAEEALIRLDSSLVET